jgi:hypothetical protein
MASCYGPACVSACPLLVFKRSPYAGDEAGFRASCGSGWSLVATGSLANVEPDRIMLKKVPIQSLLRSRGRCTIKLSLLYRSCSPVTRSACARGSRW